MWLDNLKELKKQSGMSTRQIVERTNLPERTVTRIFAGDTPNPLTSTLHCIVAALGGSLDDILADSKLVVGNKDLVTLQEKVDLLVAENDVLRAENTVLQNQVNASNAEIELLKLKLAHKEELLALHNYYNKIKG